LKVKIRYKNPDENKIKELSVSLIDNIQKLENAPIDFIFITAVVEFGLLIRDSEFKQNANFAQAIILAKSGKGKDDNGYRAEFIQLIENAKLLFKKDVISKNDDE